MRDLKYRKTAKDRLTTSRHERNVVRVSVHVTKGDTFPFPIRVSAGFLVIGLSGKIRIQTFPPRLMCRVSATRAASICRFVIQPGSSAWRP